MMCHEVPLLLIEFDPHKVRDIKTIRKDIQENGLLMPLTLVYDAQRVRYGIVYGRRRLAAVRSLVASGAVLGDGKPASEVFVNVPAEVVEPEVMN